MTRDNPFRVARLLGYSDDALDHRDDGGDTLEPHFIVAEPGTTKVLWGGASADDGSVPDDFYSDTNRDDEHDPAEATPPPAFEHDVIQVSRQEYLEIERWMNEGAKPDEFPL